MKYQNNRKELDKRLRFITARVGSTSENEIIKNLAILSDDFLAQKEDMKEEQPCNNFKPASNDEGYETTKYPHQCPICKGWRGFCLNCNKDHHENGWDSCNPTPSPLEGFEEIESIGILEEGETYWMDGEFQMGKCELIITKKVNQLISNQKKLYQYIKEKKI